MRGERPSTPTGYHLLARWFGHVDYVSRAEYVDRAAILHRHQEQLLKQHPLLSPAQVAVLPEGGATPLALLGLVRAIESLAQHPQANPSQPLNIVVDCGTGMLRACIWFHMCALNAVDVCICMLVATSTKRK